MRKWKRELDFLGANAGVLGAAAFLAAMGGVLLWVSGGSGWYFYKTAGYAGPPSVASLFALSLVLCGLCGGTAGMLLLWGRAACPMRSVLPSAGCTAGTYLFHLGWYAAALCTRLTVFGGILACLSVLCTLAARLLLPKSPAPPFVFTASTLLLLCAGGYFIYVTFVLIL